MEKWVSVTQKCATQERAVMVTAKVTDSQPKQRNYHCMIYCRHQVQHLSKTATMQQKNSHHAGKYSTSKRLNVGVYDAKLSLLEMITYHQRFLLSVPEKIKQSTKCCCRTCTFLRYKWLQTQMKKNITRLSDKRNVLHFLATISLFSPY